MTIPTFSPPISPSPGTSDTPEIKLLSADFGDGYSQITADGINHMRSVREIVWEVLTIEHRNMIVSFLKERGGYQPFLFRLPHDTKPLKFTCPKWSETIIAGRFYRVTATFRQTFSLAS